MVKDINTMPTLSISKWLQEHKHTSMIRHAHPITEDVFEAMEDEYPMIVGSDLALLQAEADRARVDDTDLLSQEPVDSDDSKNRQSLSNSPNSNDSSQKHEYYRVTSSDYISLLNRAQDRYDNPRIEVESIPRIVEAHTRQYLRDVHDWSGDFGGETPGGPEGNEYDPTLCNAMNNDDVEDLEHYGYVDSRGLVVEIGTHV